MEVVAEGIEEQRLDAASTLKSATRDALPWVEKYRPSSLEELIAHEDIITILNKLIESNKLPHLLFHGPPGTGGSTQRLFPTANLHFVFLSHCSESISTKNCIYQGKHQPSLHARRKCMESTIHP